MAHSKKQRNREILKNKTHHIFLSTYEWIKNILIDYTHTHMCLCGLNKKNVNLNKISGHIIVLLHHDKYFKSSWIFSPL